MSNIQLSKDLEHNIVEHEKAEVLPCSSVLLENFDEINALSLDLVNTLNIWDSQADEIAEKLLKIISDNNIDNRNVFLMDFKNHVMWLAKDSECDDMSSDSIYNSCKIAMEYLIKNKGSF